MSNLDKLIEWIDGYKQLYAHSEDCMKMAETIKAKVLQLQKEEPKTYTQEDLIGFANWISENYTPNGRKECWDSKELNSKYESKYLIDSTKDLFEMYLKNNPPKNSLI